MISMIDGLPAGVIGFEAKGKVEAADYRDTLVPAIDRAIQETGKARLLYVLGEDFEGYTPAAMWDDAVVGTRDWSKWEKVAVVSDTEWVHATVHAFAWMVPSRIRLFPVAERDAAVAWLVEE